MLQLLPSGDDVPDEDEPYSDIGYESSVEKVDIWDIRDYESDVEEQESGEEDERGFLCGGF